MGTRGRKKNGRPTGAPRRIITPHEISRPISLENFSRCSAVTEGKSVGDAVDLYGGVQFRCTVDDEFSRCGEIPCDLEVIGPFESVFRIDERQRFVGGVTELNST